MNYSEDSESKRAAAARFAGQFGDDEPLNEKANNMQGDVEFEDANESCWNVGININDSTENGMDKSVDFSRLTNKKKQYLQDAIVDKNGAYSFLEDPVEYKKARKRLQNRESAVRSRQRKKNYQETLEQQLDDQSRLLDRVTEERDALKKQNTKLLSENSVLKQQVAYFQETFATSNLIGGQTQLNNVPRPQSLYPQQPQNMISQDDLDRFKADILAKINYRFLLDDEKKALDDKEKNEQYEKKHQRKFNEKYRQKNDDDNIIKPEKGSIYGDIAADDQQSCSDLASDDDSLNLKNPMEQLLCGPQQKKIKKRQRVNSGTLNLDNVSHCSASTLTDNSLFKSHGETDRDGLYVLKRDSGSFQSRGYLFLAVAFGMMAYQSYTGQNSGADLPSSQIPTVNVPSKQPFNGMRNPLCASDVDNLDDHLQNMNLVSSDVSDSFLPESQLQDAQVVHDTNNSNKQTEEVNNQKQNQFTGKMTLEQMGMHSNISPMLKSLIKGKYQYLTFLMSSTACMFFWLAPNHHKMQLIKPVTRVVRKSSSSKQGMVKSQKGGKNNSSKYILYNDKLMKVDEVAIQDENDDQEMEF